MSVRLNGSKLAVAVAVAFAAFFSLLIARGVLQNATNATICQKVDRLDATLVAIVQAGTAALKPGDPGYAYYRAHPDEAANRGVGAESAIRQLRKAACDPKHLPTGG